MMRPPRPSSGLPAGASHAWERPVGLLQGKQLSESEAGSQEGQHRGGLRSGYGR